MTAQHLTHASEVYCESGPTGEHVEVLAGEVRDYGGNCLFAGTADDCVEAAAAIRLPHRLVPTTWRDVDGDVCGADHTWQCVSR